MPKSRLSASFLRGTIGDATGSSHAKRVSGKELTSIISPTVSFAL
jgi:hypothetical protein